MSKALKIYLYINIFYYFLFWTIGFQHFQQSVLTEGGVNRYAYFRTFYEPAIIETYILILALVASRIEKTSYKVFSLLYFSWLISNRTEIVTYFLGDPNGREFTGYAAIFLTSKSCFEVFMFFCLFWQWRKHNGDSLKTHKIAMFGFLFSLYLYITQTAWKEAFFQLFNPSYASVLISKNSFIFIIYNIKLFVATSLFILVAIFIAKFSKLPKK